ncbi:MAG: DUF429 domain-containing protein [Rhodoferax sp.]|jgi:hypothetical protein|nr:DUF429 domain-containing protein [Rhodoferax sp.]
MAALLGCDFSSSPGPRKHIVLAWGHSDGARLVVDSLVRLQSLGAFTSALQSRAAWIGGFDLPFGLPRELVEHLGWPTRWEDCIAHYAALPRPQIRDLFAAFCDSRPAGAKFAHRATDGPAGSSPSMKWVNPPVAYMLHAGVPALMAAGAHFPGSQAPDPQAARIALEAYPGMLAREVLGAQSYKSDDKAKQTPERLIARKDLINALELGQTRWGTRLKLSHAQRDALAQDASGDALDAVLCLVQAAWGQRAQAQGDVRYGLPADTDPLEGWILGA